MSRIVACRILNLMAKETVFTPYGMVRENIVGCIVIHPLLGHGLVTSKDVRRTGVRERYHYWTVLWSESATVEETSERVIRECRVIRPGDDDRQWGSWNEVTGG